MRPTTKRRLLIIFVVSLVVLGGVGGFVVLRLNQISSDYQKARSEGMKAFADGKYEDALNQLSTYMKDEKNKTDADVVYAMAVSRSMVPLPNGQHLKTAMDWFNNYLSFRPGEPQGQHKLLEIYARVGWNRETLALADDILKVTPNDLPALRAKATALSAQGNYPASLAASEKINELNPFDLESQRLTYFLMSQLKRPAAELLARAKAGLDAHPNDPRFEMFLASAYSYAGDQTNAQKLLDTAVQRKAPDAEFVRMATNLLDSNGQYEMSEDLLNRAAGELNDPQVLQMLVQRLWQNGRADEMAKRLESVKTEDPKADTNLLAMKAISLLEQNRAADALAVVKVLASRSADENAFAWSTAIPARYAVPAPDPRAAIATLTAAATRDRDNAVVRLWLGEAYAKINETELAINAWRSAATLSPGWAEPHIREAMALATHGRGREAVDESVLATQRAPKLIRVRVASALALSALSANNPEAVPIPELLRAVTQIQTDEPNEPQTLPMYVAMLARSGDRDKAITTIKKAIAASPALPADSMLQLAGISIDLGLGQHAAIYDAMTAAGNKSPELALAKARLLKSQGEADQGAQLMKDSAAGTKDPAAWQIATARYYDQSNNPSASLAWKSAVEQFPTDLRVQSAFLQSDTRLTERPVWSATIERVKALTIEEGVTWRLEHARYLLNGNSSDRDRAEAVSTLNELLRTNPELIDLHLLLASALMKNGNVNGATEQLKIAISLHPGDPQIALSLATLLLDSGKTVEGQAYLEKLASGRQLSPIGVRVVSRLMAEQGQIERAIQVLGSESGTDPSRDALLAQLTRRLGKADAAAAMFDKLAVAKPINTDAITQAAEFYYATGKPEQAAAVLKRLPEATDPPAPGITELIRAQLAEQYQTTEAAKEFYLAATKASPDAQTWRALAGFQLRQHDFASAKASAMQGLSVAKDDPELTAIVKLADASTALPPNVNVNGEIETLSRDPLNAAAQALFDAAVQSAAAKEGSASRITRYKALVDRFPKSWPASRNLIQAYLDAGQSKKAKETCIQTANAFPSESGPLQMLAAIYAEESNWTAELTTVQQWRSRSLDYPRPCDLAGAEALIGLGQQRQALAMLQPYLDAAKKDPVNNFDVLWPYTRALLQTGRTAEAASLFETQVRTQGAVRRFWLAFSGEVGPDNTAAVAWIEKVAPLLDPQSLDDQNALAQAWFRVAERYHAPDTYAQAAKLLRVLASGTDSNLRVWEQLGESLRALKDFDNAEEAYRQAILRGDTAFSGNALAFLLLSRDKSLDEALALSNKAIDSAPREPGYYDTRGQVHLHMDKFDLAIKSFDQALALQPDLIDSLVGKADALTKLGKRPEAANLLKYIDALVKRETELSPYAQKQLEALKAASAN